MDVCMYVWMDVTRVFPLAACCSGTVRVTVAIFSHDAGPVHPFVVLKFGARATFGSSVGGASLRPVWLRPLPMILHVICAQIVRCLF